MKKNINIEEQLGLLSKIEQVDAPPFLLTRIKQQISNKYQNKVTATWKWGFAIATTLLILVNSAVLLKSDEPATNNTEIASLVSDLQLSPSNYLYNE